MGQPNSASAPQNSNPIVLPRGTGRSHRALFAYPALLGLTLLVCACGVDGGLVSAGTSHFDHLNAMTSHPPHSDPPTVARHRVTAQSVPRTSVGSSRTSFATDWSPHFDQISDPGILRTLRADKDFGWDSVFLQTMTASGDSLQDLIDECNHAIEYLTSSLSYRLLNTPRFADPTACTEPWPTGRRNSSSAPCKQRDEMNTLRAVEGIRDLLAARKGTELDDERETTIVRDFVSTSNVHDLGRVYFVVDDAPTTTAGPSRAPNVITIDPGDVSRHFEVPLGSFVLITSSASDRVTGISINQNIRVLRVVSRVSYPRLPHHGVALLKAITPGTADLALRGTSQTNARSVVGPPWEAGYQLETPLDWLSKTVLAGNQFVSVAANIKVPGFILLSDFQRESYWRDHTSPNLSCSSGEEEQFDLCWPSCIGGWGLGPFCFSLAGVSWRGGGYPPNKTCPGDSTLGTLGQCWYPCMSGFQPDIRGGTSCWQTCPPSYAAVGLACSPGTRQASIWAGINDDVVNCSKYSTCPPDTDNNILQEGIQLESYDFGGVGVDTRYAWTQNFPDPEQIAYCPGPLGIPLWCHFDKGDNVVVTSDVFSGMGTSAAVGRMYVADTNAGWDDDVRIHNYHSLNVEAEWIVESNSPDGIDHLTNFEPIAFSNLNTILLLGPDGSADWLDGAPLSASSNFWYYGGSAMVLTSEYATASPPNAAGNAFTVAYGPTAPSPPP